MHLIPCQNLSYLMPVLVLRRPSRQAASRLFNALYYGGKLDDLAGSNLRRDVHLSPNLSASCPGGVRKKGHEHY